MERRKGVIDEAILERLFSVGDGTCNFGVLDFGGNIGILVSGLSEKGVIAMPIERNWLSNHHSFGTGYKKGYKDGYVKAIEEFAEQIKARAHSTERRLHD